MPRAVIYCRISSDPSGAGLGVARQETDCRALVERNGWTLDRVYVDNDVSASTGKPRPAYRSMLSALASDRIAAVVVWDLDRLHRRPIELEEFLDIADRHRLSLASVGGDVDLATPQGRMVARIKGAVARQEAEQISRRVRRKQRELAEAGRVGNAVFGRSDTPAIAWLSWPRRRRKCAGWRAESSQGTRSAASPPT